MTGAVSNKGCLSPPMQGNGSQIMRAVRNLDFFVPKCRDTWFVPKELVLFPVYTVKFPNEMKRFQYGLVGELFP
jgi:hypothetical protein